MTKPSERIEAIRQQIIDMRLAEMKKEPHAEFLCKVSGIGDEEMRKSISDNPRYHLAAIIQYLDNVAEEK